MMERQKEYWEEGIFDFLSKRILPYGLLVVSLLTMVSLIPGVHGETDLSISQNITNLCIDNSTLRIIMTLGMEDIQYNFTQDEVCPYGCSPDMDRHGAGCNPSPMELSGMALGIVFIMFAIIYGWARLTYKKRRF